MKRFPPFSRHFPAQIQAACALALAAFFCASAAYGGAWTLPKRRWLAISSLSYYRTDKFFDTEGHAQSQDSYAKPETRNYLEYGLTDYTTLGFNSAIYRSVGYDTYRVGKRVIRRRRYNYGLTNPEVFLRQALWKNERWFVSFQPTLQLPSLNRSGAFPKAGSDHIDAEGLVQAGYSFPLFGAWHFAQAELGYRKRFGEPRDQVKLNLAAGFRLRPDLLLMPQLFGTFRADRGNFGDFTFSSADEYDLIKAQLSAVVDVNARISLEAGVFGHVWGKNTGGGGGAFMALWYRF